MDDVEKRCARCQLVASRPFQDCFAFGLLMFLAPLLRSVLQNENHLANPTSHKPIGHNIPAPDSAPYLVWPYECSGAAGALPLPRPAPSPSPHGTSPNSTHPTRPVRVSRLSASPQVRTKN